MVEPHVIFPKEHESKLILKKMTHLIVINNFYKQIRENIGKITNSFLFQLYIII